jgi:5-formyltetrahydrofolate cyclo-ligase
MNKRILREKIKRIRENLDENIWKENSKIIQKKFVETEYYKNSKSIFTYFAFDGEVITEEIIKKAIKDSKNVCLPFIDWKNKILIPSLIYNLEEIKTYKKIPVPEVLRPFEKEKIDVVIVPGVVFDIYKNRIGMGGGFYDRFLKNISEKTKKIALAFEFQVLNEKLPVDENDIKVDIIITEKRIINSP